MDPKSGCVKSEWEGEVYKMVLGYSKAIGGA